MLAITKQSILQRFQRFYQRYPAARVHRLNRRNLFIFPSKSGFGFLLLDAVLWLVGTNYENNLVLMLAFMMATIFIISILHTFANLAGIELEIVDTKPTFCGDDAEVTLLVKKNGKRGRENIHIKWPGGNTELVNLIEQAEARVNLFVPTKNRGWCNPGRMLVETYFPLGLLRCWIWPDLNCRILVYPKPIAAGPLPIAMATADDGDFALNRGSEDFSGYRHYQPGDSLRNVAWKQYARGMGVYSKEFVTYTDSRLWLDWEQLSGLDREARLSRLCYWVLQAYATNREYGLRLLGVELPPGAGLHHKDEVLRTLALFEVPNSQLAST